MTISARGLSIGYGSRTVASGIDFNVAEGEVHCLLGANGSGKTTLFKTLIGLLSALDGEITVDGSNLRSLSARELARHIAYVPQQHAPPFPFQVRDVVMMGRQASMGLFSAPGRADRERVRQVLELIGISDLAEADYSRISGGQRQMVLIARALAQDTRLLVFDEPTASLDYGNQVKVLGEVARLARGGYGVVLSTHNPDHAFAIADRVTLLHDGRISASGAPADVMTAERLSALYGVGISVRPLDGGGTICTPLYEAPGHEWR